ncbi:hypothetical protein ABFV05_010796 [Capra hircus]
MASKHSGIGLRPRAPLWSCRGRWPAVPAGAPGASGIPPRSRGAAAAELSSHPPPRGWSPASLPERQTLGPEAGSGLFGISHFPPRLPGSPAAPTLLSLLSGTLSGLARFFALLLRRPPTEASLRRRDFSALIPALPAAGLSPGQEERPGRLSLLLRAALALPGRPSGGRLPREVDASAGQSSPIPSLWKREGAPAVCEAASQTLRLYASLSSGYSKPTGDKLPPPPRAPTPQPSATAGLGGQGGNDVVLF